MRLKNFFLSTLVAAVVVSMSFSLLMPSVAIAVTPETPASDDADDATEDRSDRQSVADITASSVSGQAAGDVTITEHAVSLFGTISSPGAMAQATGPAGELYVAWFDSRDGGIALYFARSIDGGSTFGSPIRIDKSSGAGTIESAGMRVLADVHGNVVVVFSDTRDLAAGQIFTATSRDKGATFAPAVKVDAGAALTVFGADTNDLATVMDNAGNVYVAWEDWRNDPVPGDGTFLANIFSARSTDFGATWEPSVIVDDDPVGAYEKNPVMAMGRNGALTVMWETNRNDIAGTKTDLMYAYSTDFGATFPTVHRVNTSAAGTEEINSYNLCSDGAGYVYAFWDAGAAFPTGSAYVRTSTNFGRTFDAPAIKLSGNADGDKLAGNCTYGSRNAIVGFSGGPSAGDTDNIMATITTDGGATWSATTKVDIGDPGAVGDADEISVDIDKLGNAIIVWNDDRATGGKDSGYVNYSSDFGATWNSTDIRFTNGTEGTVHTELVSQEPGSLSGVAGNDRGTFQLFWHSDVAGGDGVYYSSFAFEGTNAPTVRAAGSNRYNTAIAASKLMHPEADTSSAVVFATGEEFPDGLAATPLAAYLNAPILLVRQDSMSAETLAEFARVFDGVADTQPDAFIIGGTAAIASSIEATIAAVDANVDVKRLAGPNRKATSVAVAEELDLLRGFGPSEVLITRADAFPDALAAGAIGGNPGRNGQLMPVLLTDSGTLDPGVAGYLGAQTAGTLGTAHVIGGSVAVSDDVFASIGSIVGPTFRHAGADRYATAVQVARDFLDSYFAPDGPLQSVAFGLATGQNFADALGGGAYAAQQLMPLLLTKQGSVPTATGDYLIDNSGSINNGTIFGGTAAVSQGTQDAVNTLY